MKRLYRFTILAVVIFVLFGCSNIGHKGNIGKSEIYYFESLYLYDQNHNRIGQYSCDDEGLGGSYLKVNMDSKKTEYSLIHDGKELFRYKGNIVEEEKEEGNIFYTIDFEGLDGLYMYANSEDDSIKSFSAENGNAGSVIYSLSKEKASSSNTIMCTF